MHYKCKNCDFELDTESMHLSSSFMDTVLDHEKNKCIKKRGKYTGEY